jgi:hypothetical protein
VAGPQLPDLRVVAAGDILLHEEPDRRRTALLHHRMTVEQVVKNPPVVTSLGDSRYLVLDGANRTSALWEIGVPDIVVQVVDYADVDLTTWFHLIVGVPTPSFREAVLSVPGLMVEEVDLERARADWRRRSTLGYVVLPDGIVLSLSGADDLLSGVSLLRDVVGTYEGAADIHRVQDDLLEDLTPHYSELTGLVVFPPFRPADIRRLAENDVKLPTGITRHVIPRRALRLQTELRFLWSESTRLEKNRWLAEWTRHKLQAGEIRYYHEPTFLFDE